jgi:hypothetical protein
MWEISSLAENQLASEGLCSMESVSIKPTSPGFQFLPLPLSIRILASLLDRWSQKLSTFSPIVCPFHRDTLLIHALIPGTFTALSALSCTYIFCVADCVHTDALKNISREKWLYGIYKETGNAHVNVTVRRVRANIVAVEKKWVLHILSVRL